ncbi:MAG: CmcJ/NvfI family oxidoreductase [Sphingomicrobium sp.]
MATIAELKGLLPPDFASADRLQIDVAKGPPAGFRMPRFGPFEIDDARSLQSEAASEAAFFEAHGFVLLAHETVVREWDADPASPESSEVVRLYYPEVDQLVRRRLLPGLRIEVHQWTPPLRRGRNTATPQYAAGVHSDYGLTPEDFQVSIEAFGGRAAAEGWRSSYERDEVEAFLVIDLWRPTNMAGPLLHMPLALCDPSTVEVIDLVPTAMTGIAPSGLPTNHVALRYNPAQHWYYYPRMRTDEVLAFKLFECRKDDPGPTRFRSVLHTAFADCAAPANAEERQSCEHRVGVTILSNQRGSRITQR